MNGKVMHFYQSASVTYLREKVIASNSTPDGDLGSCLVISSVKLPEGKNKETAAETTEKMKKFLTDSPHIDPTELNNEIDKVHRLPLTNKQKQIEKTSSTPNIMCKFKTHSYREKLFSEKNELYNNSNKKIKFHVSLTKHRLDLLEKAQNHIQNLQGIKFCFADPSGNLKVKFNNNKKMNFDYIESLGNIIERKLVIGELSNQSIEKMYYQYDNDADDINGCGNNEIQSIYN